MTRATCETEIVELASDASRAMFDEVARQEMSISGEEFLQRWNAGEWQGCDFDEVPGLVNVWMYLPFAQ